MQRKAVVKILSAPTAKFAAILTQVLDLVKISCKVCKLVWFPKRIAGICSG